jgi:alanyl-tRNA synthetase
MLSREIRRKFLSYFKGKGHRVVPSSPVVPFGDPSLLFTNAGMNQFKDVFTGQSKRDYTRAVTTQKCIRVGGKHNDLENVGHTSRHLTFFEMLGNFSFGDYFKKEAIDYAWEVVTEVFEFDPKKIWVSVFRDDDEAFSLWENYLPAHQIVRFGEKENFWAMGDSGPCGPCSELLYDRGESYNGAKSPVEDASGERYLEFWNLVFMQFERETMQPLPKQSIDTGSGLERVVSLKMGVDNVFLTDVLRSLIGEVEKVSGKRYEGGAAFHVIADHIRSLSFAIADGVQPSNTDRGYVLRKILRRAVRYGRLLGLNRPFLGSLVPQLIHEMGSDFPELGKCKDRIEEILTLEEESFFRTLQRGGALLGEVMARSKEKKRISGEDAFKLKDTYGLPLEEIELIAKDEHLELDRARYDALEEEAREKSKRAQKTTAQSFNPNLFADYVKKEGASVFEGYENTEAETTIGAILVGETFVEAIEEGQEATVVLKKTPFYAEMGGQVGDQGTIVSGLSSFQVTNTLSPFPGVIAHVGKMSKGTLRRGETIKATIDRARRNAIANHHTATHLLHFALQQVLGSHIKQAGSLVDEKRLRFDFNHHKPLSEQEKEAIEDQVNEAIRANLEVRPYEMAYEEAQKKGEIKQFFGEKYGDRVRVVDIDFSKELCGGTHASRTGNIGFFKIAKESSIAAGVRRIEAVAGKGAETLVREGEAVLAKGAELLKATSSTLLERLCSELEEKKRLELELKGARRKELSSLAEKLMARAGTIRIGRLVASEVDLPFEELALLAEEVMSRLGSGVVALGAKKGGKCQLLIQVSPDLVVQKVEANGLIKQIAPLIEGGGGGKAALAQAGGKREEGLCLALAKVGELLRV